MPFNIYKPTEEKSSTGEQQPSRTLKGYIYSIRGVRVMLDMDLAKIYGYSTKDFNRQVKNNIEKFEPQFGIRNSS